MPSTTFESLDPRKRERIKQALVEEFSQHPVARAQVARIVQSSQISRGAFYVYFADLVDSYDWVLAQALSGIEDDLMQTIAQYPDDTLQAFVAYTSGYVTHLNDSPYRALYSMHWMCNEAYISENRKTHSSGSGMASHRFAAVPIVVGGRPITDVRTHAAVLDMLTLLTHHAVKTVLTGGDLKSCMATYETVVDLIRSGLAAQLAASVGKQ